MKLDRFENHPMINEFSEKIHLKVYFYLGDKTHEDMQHCFVDVFSKMDLVDAIVWKLKTFEFDTTFISPF